MRAGGGKYGAIISRGKHIEELKRKYGGDEDPEYSDLDRKLIAKFRQ